MLLNKAFRFCFLILVLSILFFSIMNVSSLDLEERPSNEDRFVDSAPTPAPSSPGPSSSGDAAESSGGFLSGLKNFFSGGEHTEGYEEERSQIQSQMDALKKESKVAWWWKNDDAKAEYKSLEKDLALLEYREREQTAVQRTFTRVWFVAENILVPLGLVFLLNGLILSLIIWITSKTSNVPIIGVISKGAEKVFDILTGGTKITFIVWWVIMFFVYRQFRSIGIVEWVVNIVQSLFFVQTKFFYSVTSMNPDHITTAIAVILFGALWTGLVYGIMRFLRRAKKEEEQEETEEAAEELGADVGVMKRAARAVADSIRRKK